MKYFHRISFRHCYQWLCLLFTCLLVISAWSAYKNLRANFNRDVILGAEHILSYKNTEFAPGEKGALPTVQFKQNSGRAALAIVFPTPVRTGVLEIAIDPSAELYRNDMFFRLSAVIPPGGSRLNYSLNIKSNKWLPLRPDNHVYRIPLYRDHVKTSVILEIKYFGALPGIPITSITLKPATFYDFPAGGLLICLGVVTAMFLPGLIVASSNPKLTVLPLPISGFLYSLAINLFGLLIVKIFNNDILFLPVAGFTTIVTFLICRSRKHTWKSSCQLICNRSISDLNVWFTILFMVFVAMSFLYPSVVSNIQQGHLSREHTFHAFTAHDSVFQFANSKSILENNFEKYYGNEDEKKLLFMPQDREILPGLGYAPIILFLKPFLGDELAGHYFPYAVYFLLCNALLLSMLFTWLQSYDLKLAYAAIFFIGTTPVFWVMAMLGWFKLTGAALTLAGIYIIRNRPLMVMSWLWAGILFGLAKNYHGGNALVLPILTLWLLFATYKSSKTVSIKKLLLLFVSVTVATCVVIFPWNWYLKNIWHVGSHRLLSIHFLNNNFVPESGWLSVQQFFSQVPFMEQLGVRVERTFNLFNVSKFIDLFASYDLNGFDSVAAWLKFSSSYLLPSVIFCFLLALIIIFISKKLIPVAIQQPLSSDLWLNQFGWMCLVNIIVLAFASYGRAEGNAGITWHFPPLLIIGVLSFFVCWSCSFHRKMSLAWFFAGFFQLGLLLAYG